MKKVIILLFSTLIYNYAKSQDSIETKFKSLTESHIRDSTNLIEYLKWIESHGSTYFNTRGEDVKKLLVDSESNNINSEIVLPSTRSLISGRKSKDDLYSLVLIERALIEDINLNIFLKQKLIALVSSQINLVAKYHYPYYTYPTKNKQLIKFISIRTGNDLFTVAGLYDMMPWRTKDYIRDNRVIFQRNDDRDYTGSFLIEVGTDFMNSVRKRPLKTYQTILYGFDVYTPYFKDSLIFPADTSYNTKDRPHASFQYFGWSKKGLAKKDKYRWTTTIKFGKIGGSAGAKFQNTLHQDISYSPRPRGWDAQISNKGRVGVSFEFKEEYQWTLRKNLNENSFWNLHLSAISEQKVGTYMTNASLGLQLSNKNFAQNNHNFINHRVRNTVYNKFHHLMWNVSYVSTYVIHNSMLEGYGIFQTREGSNDKLTPSSLYYLNKEKYLRQVRRVVHVFGITLSYTKSFGTIFYNWKSISPETRKSYIGIKSPAGNRNEMNIINRWHHFAEIGVTFNIH